MRALVRFGKLDRLRFISHLDLQRFFQRTLNRTGLDIAYSQGFNPHPIMSFASALALNWTSEYEVLDFKLACEASREEVISAMRKALPSDLPVYDARMVDDRYPACMSEVVMADYLLKPLNAEGYKLKTAIDGYMADEHIEGIRKTKSGERVIDMRPLTIALDERGEDVYTRLMLTERETLKPDAVINELAARAGAIEPELRIHRICLLKRSASGDVVPLLDM